ncbi:hypothetical protein Csa_003423 [Cucumis sativus]|uniref:Uncharacterized protein n=1 Tax=Cucumis sativus TaxID=3659 RepID=A0A0A0KJ19_CUCSA|nr:hypothetical protein Csa_003423 [Cucumis sativus]
MESRAGARSRFFPVCSRLSSSRPMDPGPALVFFRFLAAILFAIRFGYGSILPRFGNGW